MRREWQLDFGEDWMLVAFVAWAFWLFFWLFAWIGLHATVDGGLGHHRPMHWPSIAALCLMGAPTVMGMIGFGAYQGWRHRPRHVLVPIKEDLRKAERC